MAVTTDDRVAQMVRLLEQWAAEICRYPMGTVELHFSEGQVKAALKISLGVKKA